MRNKFFLFYVLTSFFVWSGCSSDPLDSEGNGSTTITPGDDSNSDGTTGDDLQTFDIQFDTSDLTDETEVIPSDSNDPDYEDYLENSSFSTIVNIAFAGNTVTTSDMPNGIEVTQEGGHIVLTSTIKKVDFVISGSSSDGSLKIYSDNKFKLTLDGANLTNTKGAAINIQSKKRVFLVAADGSENTLTDGSAYVIPDGEDMKGCIFSEGKILFSGKGTINVNGNYKHAICSDDYVRFRKGTKFNIVAKASNGVKANDGIFIGGGILNIDVKGNGAKGLSSDSILTISGGRTTIITSGEGVYEDNDVSGAGGIKCDDIFTMNGGELYIKSTGNGGKGISSDKDMFLNGGVVKVLTTGKEYTYGQLSTSPKAIKSDANLTINNGKITVRATGGEGSEGIESKAILTINKGDVEVSTYDDCINATKQIVINGGNVYCYSSGNDAIDSNGTLTITGGVVVASGTGSPEGSFDCDQNTFSITGGTLIGVGGSSSTPTSNSCKQPVFLYGGSAQAGAYVSIEDSNSKNILIYKIPRTYNSMVLLISSPSFTQGSSYTLSSVAGIKDGSNFHGLITDGNYTNSSKVASFTISSMVTTSGSFSGGGGQGGRP